MSKHTIIAHFEIPFDDEARDCTFSIQFQYTAGAPARGPSYASGGEPADPAEVEFISARCLDDDGLLFAQRIIDEYCIDWLESDEGYEAACADAEQDIYEAGVR